MRARGLGLKIDGPGGVTVSLRLSLLIAVAALWVTYAMLLVLAANISDQIAYSGSAVFIGVITYLVSVLAHEVGHGLAYRLCGLSWSHLELSLTPRVCTSDIPRYGQQVFISIAGPLAGAVPAMGVVLLGMLSGGSVLVLIGVLPLAEALLNLLVPLSRRSDAAKLYVALYQVMRGRAQFPLHEDAYLDMQTRH